MLLPWTDELAEIHLLMLPEIDTTAIPFLQCCHLDFESLFIAQNDTQARQFLQLILILGEHQNAIT